MISGLLVTYYIVFSFRIIVLQLAYCGRLLWWQGLDKNVKGNNKISTW